MLATDIAFADVEKDPEMHYPEPNEYIGKSVFFSLSPSNCTHWLVMGCVNVRQNLACDHNQCSCRVSINSGLAAPVSSRAMALSNSS